MITIKTLHRKLLVERNILLSEEQLDTERANSHLVAAFLSQGAQLDMALPTELVVSTPVTIGVFTGTKNDLERLRQTVLVYEALRHLSGAGSSSPWHRLDYLGLSHAPRYLRLISGDAINQGHQLPHIASAISGGANTSAEILRHCRYAREAYRAAQAATRPRQSLVDIRV